ncbi:peptidoglycan/LPS O-acetylase OafA/YrhL [Nocardia sp. GAS34]|uniref:acyltransferase n=1 Tax=unclassified Nocardia TaxID=2637762 RepID=UPI003D21C57B
MTTQDNRTIGTAAVTLAEPPADPPRPRKAKRPYLYQIDLFRILTFACVIAVHVITGATPGNVTANGLEALLHFTREAFFALTGFVLVYQYGHRQFSARAFWRRRFALIGIPYLVWSVFYWGYSIVLQQYHETVGQSIRRLGVEIVTGEAWYQMYFLLVTMQAYLLFPLLVRLLRATEGRHRWVLAASGALQLAIQWAIVHPPALSGGPATLWTHVYVIVFAYQFYIVLGAVAAWHLDFVDRAVRRFGALFVLGAVVSAGVSEWDYFRSVGRGMAPEVANDVFMPHLIVFYVLTIAALYTIGRWWATRRTADSVSVRAVTYASDRSFAVFLLHPLALQLMAPWVVPMVTAMGMLWGTTVLYVCVVAISLATAEIVRRVPGSLWMTGRPMVRTDFSGIVRRLRTV